jgi:hypothetical protein
MNSDAPKMHGLLARFDSAGALLAAAAKLRDAGYKSFDCHSPFPIHGMDEAMGLRRSPLGWIVGFCALVGGSAGFALQWWSHAVAYPLVISGKPYFAFQAYVPVTFAVAVLSAAVSAVLGMLLLNGLPRPHHPLFSTETFARFTDDGFFVSLAAGDAGFDLHQSRAFLTSIGAVEVEVFQG